MKTWKVGVIFLLATLSVVLLFVEQTMLRAECAVQVLPTEPAVSAPPTQEATLEPTQPAAVTTPLPTVPATDPESVAVFERISKPMDAQQIFVFDCDKNQMLYQSGEDWLYPASITKLYTAWVALQVLSPEEIVTAGNELDLVAKHSSLAYIYPGQKLKVETLVKGMLLPSGNDASYVLATAAGRALDGNVSLTSKEAVNRFVQEMNRKGKELGFENSHFENPDGFHNERHYSCAADLAKIGKLALETPIMAEIMKCDAERVYYVSGETMLWQNSNHLVNPSSEDYCPYAVGMKTGFTDEAGHCLMAAFQKNGKTTIVGVFGSESVQERFPDAVALWQAVN